MIPTLQLGQLGRSIRQALGGGGGATYLDQLATVPRAVFALEKLISTATLCVRVRNSTTGTETDIGFAVGGGIDLTALSATYTAGQSVTVRTWYDQTGNGEHAENATAATQPLIVSAGSYLGHVSFNGTSQFLKVTSLTLGTPQVGIYSRHQPVIDTGIRVFFELTTVASSNSGTFLIYSNSGVLLVDSYNSSGANDRARQYASDLAMAVWTFLMDRSISGATEIMAYKNGTARTVLSEAATVEQTGNYATNDFYMGARAGASLFMQMAVQNFALYNADTASIRSSIETIVA